MAGTSASVENLRQHALRQQSLIGWKRFPFSQKNDGSETIPLDDFDQANVSKLCAVSLLVCNQLSGYG